MSHDNFDQLWAHLRADIRAAFDNKERKIMRISHRLNKAMEDLDLINRVRLTFERAGDTDLSAFDRKEGLRRARVGMLCYALQLETAKP